MKEAEAISILKNRKAYYRMKHTGYDRVIRYLEGRERRKKDKGDIEEREKLIVNEFNDLIDSLDTLRIVYFNRCTFFLESIAELEEQVHKYKEKWTCPVCQKEMSMIEVTKASDPDIDNRLCSEHLLEFNKEKWNTEK